MVATRAPYFLCWRKLCTLRDSACVYVHERERERESGGRGERERERVGPGN